MKNEKQTKIAGMLTRTDVSLSEKAAKCASLLKASRTWTDAFDDSNDDYTVLGFPKTEARIKHDAELHRQRGDNALPVDAERNPRLAALVNKNNPGAGGANVMGVNLSNPLLHAGGGALAGGAAGAMLGGKNKLRNAAIGATLGGAGTYIGSHLAQGGDVQSMLKGIGLGNLMGKTSSEKQAFPSLEEMGNYAKDLYNKVPSSVMQGAGMGGLGGAALGGLAGLVAPGEDVEYDEEGNVVGRKQRSRFGAALRGLLGGGALGALGGGAAGHFAPDATSAAYGSAMGFGGDLARRLGLSGGKKNLNTANPRSPEEVALAAEQARGGQYATSSLVPGVKSDPFSESLVKGDAKRFRDLQTSSAPGTMGGPAAPPSASVKNPMFDTSKMKAPTNATYTPTDHAGLAARRAQEAAAQAAAQKAKFEQQQKLLMGPVAYGERQQQLAAQAGQARMDQEAGVSNVSPEVLAMKKNNPALFEQMMQEARNKRMQENLKTAPNKGFDASGIDMSKMQLPASPTLGR
jgi:hypothetical protein